MYQSQDGLRFIHAASNLAQRIQQDNIHPLLLQSAVLEFLGQYFFTPQIGNGVKRISDREQKLLKIARDRLLQDLSSAPTIKELSRETGLNQLKLKQGFKQLFNSSIYAMFQRYRMDRAHALLRDHNVTETASILGYSNISHFSAAYRKQFGELPSYTRKVKAAYRNCISSFSS